MVAIVPWYLERWVSGVAALSLEEEGAYSSWVANYGLRDGLFPDDLRLLATIWRCNVQKAKRLRLQLLAKGKLYSEGGFLHQIFAKHCVSVSIAKSNQATAAAFKRWKNH